MLIAANPGILVYRGLKGHSGLFRPNGRMLIIGSKRRIDIRTANPGAWRLSSETLAARLLVGFNVNNTPRWTLQDVIPIVKRVRTKQVGDPGASFVLQKGIYQHKRTREIVEEDGAQVIIVDTGETPRRSFESQMIRLGEVLARELQQKEVIVEIQRAGITKVVIQEEVIVEIQRAGITKVVIGVKA